MWQEWSARHVHKRTRRKMPQFKDCAWIMSMVFAQTRGKEWEHA